MQKLLDWYIKFYPISDVPMIRRIGIHLFYWTIFGVFNMLAFISQSIFEYKFIITLFSIINGATIYYGVTYFAVPNLLSSRRFFFGLLILLFLYCLNFFENYIFNYLAIKYNWIVKGGSFYNYAQVFIQNGLIGIFNPQNIFREIYLVLSSVTIPFMLKFARQITKYSLETKKILKEKNANEIVSLRAQLDPQFLLNSLQNINNQIDLDIENGSESIISLSEILKYKLYYFDKKWVDLKKEILYLKSYVDLEKLKKSYKFSIQFYYKGEIDGYKIAPLILINFLENAIRQACFADNRVKSIEISLKLENEILEFRIVSEYTKFNSEAKSKLQEEVGIADSFKNLQLMYHDNHRLHFTDKNNKFIVDLSMKIEK